MSTSLLVNRMREVAKKEGIEAQIWATSEKELEAEFERNPSDVILVGSQIRYSIKQIQATAKDIPVELIDMRTYGMMDGKKVLQQGLDAIEKEK